MSNLISVHPLYCRQTVSVHLAPNRFVSQPWMATGREWGHYFSFLMSPLIAILPICSVSAESFPPSTTLCLRLSCTDSAHRTLGLLIITVNLSKIWANNIWSYSLPRVALVGYASRPKEHVMTLKTPQIVDFFSSMSCIFKASMLQ